MTALSRRVARLEEDTFSLPTKPLMKCSDDELTSLMVHHGVIPRGTKASDITDEELERLLQESDAMMIAAGMGDLLRDMQENERDWLGG